jgi:hypothetical protein
MARLMLRGPKKMAAPKKMMSPTTILKSMAPIPMNKPISPATPKSSVPTLTQRLQSMAATMQQKTVKDLKPEPASPIMLDKPKRKVPVKRSAAIRKVKKPVQQKKK